VLSSHEVSASKQDSGNRRSTQCHSFLSNFQGSTCSALAIRAMLSIETFRSERSTELRYVRLMPLSNFSAACG
jgi:hypothetical protein